ncbi:MAG: cupin domain-containing protein [Candidatus Aminicenantes bacterium]|nr:MAG: cupin domain-containing protein [Candidatus Aminicenantes bacterium]
MKKVNLKELIKKIKERWEPEDVAFINETALRVAKVEGAYDWHTHPGEDEFFLVLEGNIFIDTNTADGTIELKEMEGYLVKRGVRHRSRTEAPAWVLLVEPTRTKTKGVK